MTKPETIKNYNHFVNKLEKFLARDPECNKNGWIKEALTLVDGVASVELRKLVGLEDRRASGIFFTESKLANLVISDFCPRFDMNSVIYDPACGAGNLLISTLSFAENFAIKLLPNQLLGTDLHEEFIEAAKLRLTIKEKLSYQNSLQIRSVRKHKWIGLQQGNGLKKNKFYDKATHIITNPPFNLVDPGEKLPWATGKVSAAALFLDKILQHSKEGVMIYAILPDVLRSGSRYERWRSEILSKSTIGRIKLLGQFDKYADVDVFALELQKLKSRRRQTFGICTNVRKGEGITVGDLFEVRVGTVVDNRDPESGKCRKYIISKGLLPWEKIDNSTLTRKHLGRTFSGPLVVIKRTSRSGDITRATATILNLSKPFFVDNHLIVLSPFSKTLKDCRLILASLRNQKTTDWLNQKICCRHLTVKIVSNIPIWL